MRIVITVEKNGRKSLANGYVHNVDVSMKIHIVISVAKKGGDKSLGRELHLTWAFRFTFSR